jgi:hypothetical protein
VRWHWVGFVTIVLEIDLGWAANRDGDPGADPADERGESVFNAAAHPRRTAQLGFGVARN